MGRRHCCTFTLDAVLLAISQYSEGPATDHLDTGFSRFPYVYKQMLRRFPTFQVATTGFSCSPPDLKLLDPYFIFMYMHNNHCHRVTAHLQLNIIIIIMTIINISFMQDIYAYIPETMSLGNTVLNLLYFYISTFRSMCAVPHMVDFCSSLTSCFPGMLLTYFLNDSEMVPVAPIITGITFVFTFHVRCISTVRFYILESSRLLF